MKNGKWSGIAAAFTAALVLTGASASADDSGFVLIQGIVDPVNELVLTTVTGFNSLDLSVSAVDQQITTVNEKNNDADGYTVTLVSANATADSPTQAYMKGADTANVTPINYTMKYGTASAEVAVTLVGGSAVVTSTSAASIEAGAEKSLVISYTGSTWRNADTYNDTITFTIAAK